MRLELRTPHAPMLSNLSLEHLCRSEVCHFGESWDDEELGYGESSINLRETVDTHDSRSASPWVARPTLKNSKELHYWIVTASVVLC